MNLFETKCLCVFCYYRRRTHVPFHGQCRTQHQRIGEYFPDAAAERSVDSLMLLTKSPPFVLCLLPSYFDSNVSNSQLRHSNVHEELSKIVLTSLLPSFHIYSAVFITTVKTPWLDVSLALYQKHVESTNFHRTRSHNSSLVSLAGQACGLWQDPGG